MNFKSISKRTLAYMVMKVSGTLGGGFVVGVEIWQAAAMAAFIGTMDVLEQASRAYVLDGNISVEDEDLIFGGFSTDEDADFGGFAADEDPKLGK
jgi:hypothetical protein